VAKPLHRLTHNWQLKLTALVLAFLFWAALRREQPYRYTFDNVSIRVLNDDAEWVLATAPDPPVVRVTFEGPGGELLQVASQPPEIQVRVEDVTDSTFIRELVPGMVFYAVQPSTSVQTIEPRIVQLTFEKLGARLLPIAIDLSGRPAAGFELAGPPILEPPVIRASGGVRRLARVDSVRIPLNLDGRSGIDTLEVPIDTAGTGLILSPNRIRLILPLRPVVDTTALPPRQ
jgi:hypothetical protein